MNEKTDDEKEQILGEAAKQITEKIKEEIEYILSKALHKKLSFVLEDTQFNAVYIAEAALKHFIKYGTDYGELPSFSPPWTQQSIAAALYENNKEKIENVIIEEQKVEIESLKKHLEERKRCY